MHKRIKAGRLLVALVIASLVSFGALAIAETITQAFVDETTYGTAHVSGNSSTAKATITADYVVATEGVTIPADSIDAAEIGTIYQSDTNTTTTANQYTPEFIGQVLLGGAGSGTNAVWVAKGATTNDWVQVEP